MIAQLEETLQLLRQRKPLILNLTNTVTMDFMANALLALGAAPLMCTSDSELEELICISNCLNINIGTLDEAFIARAQKAVKLAKHHHKPIILDPVGAGASKLRTESAKTLLAYVDIVRGNASEIIALKNMASNTHGVESRHTTYDAKDIAREIAKHYQCTVVVSGAIDFITNGPKENENIWGSPLMALVTGMGCTLTASIAAFKSIVSDSFESAQLATYYFGFCGQLAAERVNTPGAFRTAFIDELYQADLYSLRDVHAE